MIALTSVVLPLPSAPDDWNVAMRCNCIDRSPRTRCPVIIPASTYGSKGRDGDRLFADRKCWGVDNWRQLPRKTRAV